jgi:hypothetical protein
MFGIHSLGELLGARIRIGLRNVCCSTLGFTAYDRR